MIINAKSEMGRYARAVDPVTGETFPLAYEVDTDTGRIDSYVLDDETPARTSGLGRIKTVGYQGPEGYARALAMVREYRDFNVIDGRDGTLLFTVKNLRNIPPPEAPSEAQSPTT